MYFNKLLLIPIKSYCKLNLTDIKTFAFFESETAGLSHLENCSATLALQNGDNSSIKSYFVFERFYFFQVFTNVKLKKKLSTLDIKNAY